MPFLPTSSSKKVVLGGYELAHQAIRLQLNLRVLYTTGSTINDKMKTMFVEGARFLQKPYTHCSLRNSNSTPSRGEKEFGGKHIDY